MRAQAIWPILLVLVSVLPVFVAASTVSPIDDQYITITYAKNLASGHGFTYNGDQPSLGTTTPLTAIILAALKLLLPSVPLDRMAINFSACCWIANGWCLYLFRKRLALSDKQAFVVAASILTINHAYLGGEYALFSLLLLVSIVGFVSKRWYLCGLLIGLLYLTRGEGGLLLPLVLLERAIRLATDPAPARRSTIKSLVLIAFGFLCIAAPWSAWAWNEFGSPFPNTLRIKMLQARLWPDALGGLFEDVLFRNMRSEWGTFAFAMFPPLRLCLWVLAGGGLLLVALRHAHWRLIVGWTVAFVTAYTLLKVPGYAFWYTLPALWAWHYLIGLGLAWLLELPLQKYWKLVPNVAVAIVLVFLAGGRILSTYKEPRDPRRPYYLSLSNWMERHAVAGDRLACYDAGFFGYFTNIPLYDFAGLIRPELLPFVRNSDELGIISACKPRFVIRNFEDSNAQGLTEAYKKLGYALVIRLPGPAEMRYHHNLALLTRSPETASVQEPHDAK